MNNGTSCLGCGFAEWKRTANGRLHPSKAGRCTWKMPAINLPNSRYFINGPVSSCGGFIDRSNVYKTECPHFWIPVQVRP